MVGRGDQDAKRFLKLTRGSSLPHHRVSRLDQLGGNQDLGPLSWLSPAGLVVECWALPPRAAMALRVRLMSYGKDSTSAAHCIEPRPPPPINLTQSDDCGLSESAAIRPKTRCWLWTGKPDRVSGLLPGVSESHEDQAPPLGLQDLPWIDAAGDGRLTTSA
jgi:hypothetical protein